MSSDDLVAARDHLERQVRSRLSIPYPAAAAALAYEHSMGQSGPLPASLLRGSLARETRRKAA
jgi:hypothetical protein